VTTRAVHPASNPLRGTVEVPGDKSVSHRALILGALAEGATRIENLAPGADVGATRSCLGALGVRMESEGETVVVHGRGLEEPFTPCSHALDAQNSGTTTRLLMGVLSGQTFEAEITGDDSLRRRPMRRVAEPLRQMGAEIELQDGERAPVRIRGRRPLRALRYELPVPSAQVKSALLLAALYADEKSSVRDPFGTRDHTERMLSAMTTSEGLRKIGDCITFRPTALHGGCSISVPRDVSSASFFLAAAALVEGSDVTLPGVGLNPTRTGFFEIIREMGGRVRVSGRNEAEVEPRGTLRARFSSLRGLRVEAKRLPALVDEVPILAVLATQAHGATRIEGAGELRVKESNRLEGVASNLRRMGARAEVRGDALCVEGPTPLRGAEIDTTGDHRLAMAFAVAGLLAEGETVLSDAQCVEVSYPGFFEDLERLSS
jgi:3-phosphoshikimate 1-carboxyvinyltransferase